MTTRISEADLQVIVARMRKHGRPVPDGLQKRPISQEKNILRPPFFAEPLVGGRPIPIVDADGMNKTERAFFSRLCSEPDVQRVRFQALKFKLGKACFYTPDFDVLRTDGRKEIWEVKGHWEDDARVKIKTAAGLFPEYAWYAVKGRVRKTTPTIWEVETIYHPIGMARPIVMFERREQAGGTP